MDEEQIIQQLVDHKWRRRTIEVWRRANFRCEYCDKNLIEYSDDYYFGAHVDHIVPGAGDLPDNLALACTSCNFIKRKRRFDDNGSVTSRAAIIERAAAHIRDIRQRNDKRLAADLALFRMFAKS
jgi:5-methylcytosine-specific restriction endonuclease McrA